MDPNLEMIEEYIELDPPGENYTCSTLNSTGQLFLSTRLKPRGAA